MKVVTKYLHVALIVLATSTAAYAQPANDDFANAEVITITPFTDSDNVALADSETGEATQCSGVGTSYPRSAWYSYTPGSSGTLDAMISNVFGNLMVAIYTGASVNALTEEDCAVTQFWGPATASISVTAGTT